MNLATSKQAPPSDMDLPDLIAVLESRIENPASGLPDEVFRFVSRLTPLVNVDLLVRNEHGEVLLTWRDDGYYGPGWHVPGGILRFKERLADRIEAVAASELGAGVCFEPGPLAMHEIVSATRETRGHFISLLYRCRLTTAPDRALAAAAPPTNGQWTWHRQCPDNLIRAHEIYRRFIDDREQTRA